MKICKPLSEEDFAPFASLPGNGFNKAVACLLDSRIRPAYKIMPTSYIACDILSGKDLQDNPNYTEAEAASFLAHIKGCPPNLRSRLLSLYAAPVL